MRDTKIPKSRGRPRAFDIDAGVEIAMRLFWERGYDGVGVAELASAIGINPPSLYSAYGSKLGLFNRAVERYSATKGAFLARLFEDRPLDNVLGDVLAEAHEVYTGDATCKGCLIMDGVAGCGDTEVCAVTSAKKDELHEAVRSLAEARGAANPEEVADYFLFLLTGLSASARDGVGPAQLDRDLALALVGLRAALVS